MKEKWKVTKSWEQSRDPKRQTILNNEIYKLPKNKKFNQVLPDREIMGEAYEP